MSIGGYIIVISLPRKIFFLHIGVELHMVPSVLDVNCHKKDYMHEHLI